MTSKGPKFSESGSREVDAGGLMGCKDVRLEL